MVPFGVAVLSAMRKEAAMTIGDLLTIAELRAILNALPVRFDELPIYVAAEGGIRQIEEYWAGQLAIRPDEVTT